MFSKITAISFLGLEAANALTLDMYAVAWASASSAAGFNCVKCLRNSYVYCNAPANTFATTATSVALSTIEGICTDPSLTTCSNPTDDYSSNTGNIDLRVTACPQ